LLTKDSTDGAAGVRARRLLIAGGVLLGFIMAGHYLTDMHAVGLHNTYRRLAYLPIVLAAFAYGTRGGLLMAAAATAVYLPHAFFSHHRDPSPDIDKLFEIALYFVLGGLTGWLVNRGRHARAALEQSLRERAALETELVRAGKMGALGHMAAGLAHEIRNPLNSIMGSAESLVAEFDESHRKHRMGSVLLREIDRLSRVVTDFVRFARPSEPARRPFDVAATARHVVELSQAEASSRNVAVSVSRPEPERRVDGDEDQISQVLLNLLLNAYQAVAGSDGDEGASVEIRFSTRQVANETMVGVGVHDNGAGIPTTQLESVFEPYFSTRDDGTGLGLAISDRIVEAHGGFMEVESTPGDTTIWAFLPAEASL